MNHIFKDDNGEEYVSSPELSTGPTMLFIMGIWVVTQILIQAILWGAT